MIICCGEVLIDMVPAFSGKVNGYLPLPGGSPYNTSIAIGRLGTPVMFLGKFSKDFFGEMLMKRLLDNNVKDDLVIRSEQNSTLAFVKLEKDKNPQYVFYTEGTADRSLSVEDLPKKIPADTHCICFGSIAMTMEPLASAIETLILRENTLQVQGKISPVISYDPNIRPFMIKDKKAFIERMQKWIAASTITKISAEDFSYIFPGLEPEKALHKILAMGPRMAIVTLGSKGAMALLRRNDGSLTKVLAPIIDLPVKDTIGAGDAFHGAFLSWLERNEKMSRSSLAALTETELYDALFFANKAASIICTRQGAEPPTLREVENLKIKKPETKSEPTKKAAPKSSATKPKTVPSHGDTEKGTGEKKAQRKSSHGGTENTEDTKKRKD
jgi:fructokinase